MILNKKGWGFIKRCSQVWASDILLAVAAARHNIARHCWAPVQRKALGWSLHNVETPKPKPRLPGSAGLCGHTHVQYCLVWTWSLDISTFLVLANVKVTWPMSPVNSRFNISCVCPTHKTRLSVRCAHVLPVAKPRDGLVSYLMSVILRHNRWLRLYLII